MTRYKLLILTLAVTLGGSAAFADTEDLYLGGTYNTFSYFENGAPGTNPASPVGGGSIMPSTLNGKALAWVYCVGLFTDVNVPEDYPNTIVQNNGMVNGALVTNAGEIAWLLDTYANAAVTDVNAQEGLQAAIWSVEYNSLSLGHPVVTGDPSAAYYSDYSHDLTALAASSVLTQNADIGTIDWFTPGGANNFGVQGLVGPGPSAVPEPTSILLFGTVLILSAKLMKRKKLGADR
jgi:hypothetical protein